MIRRLLLCTTLLLTLPVAQAAGLAQLSNADASTALRDALSQGAKTAVQQLGRPGGFASDPQLRIELPGNLGKAAKLLKGFGMGSQVQALEDGMNRAAEAAVPQAQALLIDAVKQMTLADAKGVLSGGEEAGTRYLEKSSREKIRARFLPIVKQATDQVGLAQQYNAFASKAAAFGAVDAKNTSIEGYVTEQALDGLFAVIAEQEAQIRENPAAAASSLAKRVFGMF